MNRRTLLATLGAGATTILPGCNSPGENTPTPTGRTIDVRFQNESDWTLVFTAAAIFDGMGGITIEYRDGSERTLEEVENVDDIPVSAWDGAVTFTPGADVPRRQFRSEGGSGAGFEFVDVPASTSVVTTVTRPSVEDSMLSLGAGTCGDAEEIDVAVAVDATGAVQLHTTCAAGSKSE